MTVASTGPPLLLPSLHVSITSAGFLRAVAIATRAHHQGVATRREQVQMDDVGIPETLLELDQKASCVASCDKINAKLT